MEHLRSLADDFTALNTTLNKARPIAGTEGLPALATWYANAEGLSATALSLLLGMSAQPYAHTTVSGHHAVEALGQLAKISTDITAHIVSAVAVATEYHRIVGLPDPASGGMAAQPATRGCTLDLHLDDAIALIKPALDACHNAAAFTETAGLREETRAAEPAPLPELNPRERRALRCIADHQVLLFVDIMNTRRIWTGSGERVSIKSVDSLAEKRLILLDHSGSLRAAQRLRLTEAGHRALRRLNHPSPAASPAQGPIPGTARTR